MPPDDPLAREILTETTELLTCWLGNIVDLLDPDVIVIGGGVAGMLKPFFAGDQQDAPELVRESARASADSFADGPLWGRRGNCGWGRALRRVDSPLKSDFKDYECTYHETFALQLAVWPASLLSVMPRAQADDLPKAPQAHVFSLTPERRDISRSRASR